MNQIEESIFINEMHKKIDIDKYLQILHKNKTIGGINFLSLMNYCFNQTGTTSQPFKLIRRSERLINLLNFLIYATENNKCPIAECGVFRGFSSLAMKLLLLNINRNNKLFLIDSFEGLSQPVPEDWIAKSKLVNGPSHLKGHFATPIEFVESVFVNYDNVNIIKNWIPDAFSKLPDVEWSFVHIDVDLYKPVYDSLEYFYPRMKSKGVILNDDYNSPLFPGAGIAWRKFFDLKNESYLILDSGQSVFIKN
jgi:hypothetical protein